MAQIVNNVPENIPKLSTCPFCLGPAQVFKEQLWNNGHGYYGCYYYFAGCQNLKCKIRPITKKVDDVYRSQEVAIKTCVGDWNTREVN